MNESSRARTLAGWIYLALMLSMAWTMIPAQKRLELRLRTARLARPALARLATACGRIGMHNELAGDPETAGLWYAGAYNLMVKLRGERP